MYHSHSGFPGGIKSESFNALKKRKPEKIIEELYGECCQRIDLVDQH